MSDSVSSQAGGVTSLRHPLLGLVGHTTVTVVLLTAGYYFLPERKPWGDGAAVARFLITLALFGAVLMLFRAELRLVKRRYPPVLARVLVLLSVLYLLILFFALTYFFVNRSADNQFVGIANKTDSLYFTVSTISTVGFGDVHAVGTGGRVLVTVQMIFDLVYLGTAFRLLSRRETLRTQAPGSLTQLKGTLDE